MFNANIEIFYSIILVHIPSPRKDLFFLSHTMTQRHTHHIISLRKTYQLIPNYMSYLFLDLIQVSQPQPYRTMTSQHHSSAPHFPASRDKITVIS